MAYLAIILLKCYQYLLSPALRALFGPGIARCRFQPSCSQYAIECYKKHRFIKATSLTAKRLLKCQPFFKQCDHDPVP